MDAAAHAVSGQTSRALKASDRDCVTAAMLSDGAEARALLDGAPSELR